MMNEAERVTILQRLPFRVTRSQVLRFLLSLLIATLLWGWVTQQTDPYTTAVYQEMEIGVGQLPDALQIVTTLPRGKVTLRGPESELAEIQRGDITVTLDTSPVTAPGDYRLRVRVTTPEGPNERIVEPEEIPVTVEEHISQVMPLTVEQAVPENDPRQIGDITPEVSQVTVAGPSSAVNRVDRVILPVTVDNQTMDFQGTFTPYAIDAEGQRVSEVEVLPAQIRTSVELQSRGKTVSVIPQISGVPAEGYAIQQRTALPESVIVDGPEEALASLLFVNTEPVDVSGATESISRRVGLVGLPPGVTVIEPASGTVEVRVAIEDISTTAQTLSSLPVQPINLGSGLQAEIEPSTIAVTVDGPADALTRMTPSDVKIRVDLAGLGPGEHQVQPEVTVPQGVTWVDNEPQRVTVRITEDTPDADGSPVPQSSPAAIIEERRLLRSSRSGRGW